MLPNYDDGRSDPWGHTFADITEGMADAIREVQVRAQRVLVPEGDVYGRRREARVHGRRWHSGRKGR